MSTSSPADRIRTMIESARSAACTAGRDFDLHHVYVRALVRCGLGRHEAVDLAGHQDPVGRILHFAGTSHNFAILAVEEALAEAA